MIVTTDMRASNASWHKRIKAALLLALVAVTGLTCINPIYPQQMLLQHIGTLLLVILLLSDTIKNRMPMSAFVCVMIFTLLHVVGARWIYSYVPYREWSISLGVPAEYWGVPADFHGDITVFFESMLPKNKWLPYVEFRNNYDRLIHFSFGLFMFPCLLYKVRKWVERNLLGAIIVAWLLVQTGSMIYEIFEWKLSVWSKEGDNYNGQQCDMWDAQKDMAMAMIGSTIMAIYFVIKEKCKQFHAKSSAHES